MGQNVKDVKVGDNVGVGCIVDSCLTCENCKEGEEHFCTSGMTGTYDSDTKHGHIATNTGYTFGGYSQKITMHRNFIIKA